MHDNLFQPLQSTPQFERSLRANYNPHREVTTKCTYCPTWSYVGTVEEGHSQFLSHCEQVGHTNYDEFLEVLR